MSKDSSTPLLETSKSECASVIGFYEHFDYPYGDFRSIDLSDPTVCCNMDGVTCAGDKVVSLELNGKDLYGSIPQIINELTSLKTLDLSGNQLSGSIPNLELQALETLNLQNNQLTGNVPESFNRLSNLKDLKINGNSLSGDLTCSLLNTTLNTINVDGNGELIGKVWLQTSSDSIDAYVPGTKVFLCKAHGTAAFCQSKPNCEVTFRPSEKIAPDVRLTSGRSSNSQSSVLPANSAVIASIAGVGIVALIGFLGYLTWKNRQSKFEQFDPEIKTDKKYKVHRLSLFLSKKTKNPSQMESVA